MSLSLLYAVVECEYAFGMFLGDDMDMNPSLMAYPPNSSYYLPRHNTMTHGTLVLKDFFPGQYEVGSVVTYSVRKKNGEVCTVDVETPVKCKKASNCVVSGPPLGAATTVMAHVERSGLISMNALPERLSLAKKDEKEVDNEDINEYEDKQDEAFVSGEDVDFIHNKKTARFFVKELGSNRVFFSSRFVLYARPRLRAAGKTKRVSEALSMGPTPDGGVLMDEEDEKDEMEDAEREFCDGLLSSEKSVQDPFCPHAAACSLIQLSSSSSKRVRVA